MTRTLEFNAINATENYRFGEWTEEVPDDMTLGEVYRTLVRDNGRCIGKVYVGEGTPIGWVFVKSDRYEDTGEKYLREVWVAFVDIHPETHTPVALSEVFA